MVKHRATAYKREVPLPSHCHPPPTRPHPHARRDHPKREQHPPRSPALTAGPLLVRFARRTVHQRSLPQGDIGKGAYLIGSGRALLALLGPLRARTFGSPAQCSRPPARAHPRPPWVRATATSKHLNRPCPDPIKKWSSPYRLCRIPGTDLRPQPGKRVAALCAASCHRRHFGPDTPLLDLAAHPTRPAKSQPPAYPLHL